MEKKATLKYFKVSLLKTFLTILVLSASFGLSFGQTGKTPRPQSLQPARSQVSTHLKDRADVPAVNRSLSQTSGIPKKGYPFKSVARPAQTTPPSSNFGDATATFTGSLLAGDCTMPLRLFRDGIVSTCSNTRTFPGTAGGPSHFYDVYSVTNTTATASCITITLNTTDLVNANIMAASYLGTFDPNNLATNWMGDPGLSTGTPQAAPLVYSHNLAAGATAIVVVFSANASTTAAGTASNYTLAIDGLPSSCVAPSTPTISGTTTVCSGSSTTLSVGCGAALNSAASWKWYSGSCGGTAVGTGNSITVSPTATTTYYVRGEGGCLATPGACASVTVTVSAASTAAVLSQVTLPPVPTTVFNEGFEGTVPPAGWFVQNNSNPVGATGWTQGGPLGVFAPHAGAGFISANFNNVGTLGTISNWLVCPNTPATLRNGDVLKFWTRTTTGQFPDRLQVRLNSTNGGTNVGATATSVGDFTTLLLDINPTYTTTGYPTAWTEFTLTLSGLPAGGTPGRLAFRYFVENAGLLGTNSDFIGIDDVSYNSTIPGGPPVTCTGSTANLKVDITGGTGPFTVTITPTAPAGPPIVVSGYTSGANIPVTPAVTTTYALTSVLSSAGCAGANNSGTPTITVSPTPTPGLIIVDDPTGPLCAGNPKLLTVVTTGAPSPVGTLYTQGGAVGASPVSQNFETANDGFDNQAAEDFVVPANTTWNITQVSAGGMYFNGAGPSTTYNVFIYRNSASNIPGTLVANYNNLTYTGGASPVIAIPSTSLTAGTYWLSVQSNMTFTVGGEWAWGANGTTATGLPWQWQNPNGGFGTCPSWANGAATCIVGTDRNLIFTLTGTSVAAGGPPVGYTYSWSPAAGLSSTTSNPVAASPMTTTTYTVLATAPGGCQTTAQITITVNQLPAITTQPSNTAVCAGQTATFTAVGSGAGVLYQWQVSTDGGVTWTNVTNGAPYSGATTGTLTIAPATFAMNGFRYRLSASGTCPPSANSNGAILTVNALPVVTITPGPTTCGGVATINGTLLTASSPTGSNFIWSPATGLYTNASASTAYVAGTPTATVYAAPTTNTVYTVTATNGTTGCVGTGTVTVNYTPAVPVVNPAAATICLTTPRTYQQLQITSALSGSSVSTFSSGTVNLAIPDLTPTPTISTINAGLPTGSIVSKIVVTLNMSHTYPGDMIFNLKAPNGKILNLYKFNSGLATGAASGVPSWGWYNAQISSAGGAAFSTVAAAPFIYQTPPTVFKADMLNADVTAAGFPFNNPTGYTSDAIAWTDVYPSPIGAWTLAMADGGPGDLGTLASWSIEFTYSAPTPGIWSVAGSSPAAYTGLYADATGTPYTGTPSNIVFASPAATTNYQVTVANGTCTSQPRTVLITVNTPIAITTQPTDKVVCTNNSTSFTTVATGTAITHNWQVSTNNGNPGSWVNIANGGVYSGANTATLTITAPPVSMNGYLYRDSMSTTPCVPKISNNVKLTVNPLPIVTIAAVPYTRLMPGMSTTLTSNSTPAAATYQWVRDGAVVAGATGSTLAVDIDGLGTYYLNVTDVNGCSNRSNSVLISDSSSGKVFIYPNPSSGRFQVRYYSALNNTGLARGVNVYDDKGARIITQKFTINAPYARMDIDMRKYGAGTYWVEVVDLNGNRLAMGRVLILR
jgi:subtilisin-like proprotein convertase family protein